ncbi:MAG: hypothetical protein ACJARE_000387 [Paracoccaceae bacterium]
MILDTVLIANSIAILDDTTLSARSTYFFANDAMSGGGALYVEGTATIVESAMTSNEADGGGGGAVLSRDGSVDMTGVQIRDNVAGNGDSDGGVLAEGGTASVVNATLHGNDAGQEGSAIAVLGAGAAQIDSATITGNSAVGFAGGGVFFGGSGAASDLPRSIVAGNGAAQGVDVALMGGTLGGADNLFGVAALIDGRSGHDVPAGMAQVLADDGIALAAVFDAINPLTGGGLAAAGGAFGDTVALAAAFDNPAIDANAAFGGDVRWA